MASAVERLKFFAAIEGTNRFDNIAKAWEAQGLSGDPLYSGIEADIEKRAKVERLYGTPHDNGRISAFINNLKEQTSITEPIDFLFAEQTRTHPFKSCKIRINVR